MGCAALQMLQGEGGTPPRGRDTPCDARRLDVHCYCWYETLSSSFNDLILHLNSVHSRTYTMSSGYDILTLDNWSNSILIRFIKEYNC